VTDRARRCRDADARGRGRRHDGKAPLDYAREHDNEKMIKLLDE
jgi:hypothetical protein